MTFDLLLLLRSCYCCCCCFVVLLLYLACTSLFTTNNLLFITLVLTYISYVKCLLINHCFIIVYSVELLNPQQSLSSSRQHFADGGTLNGTDEFIQHYPSQTDNSSSVMSNNQSRYFALQNGHFINDNDTHIASRSSKLSIGSLDSRYHVKCKLQKQRTIRGLDKFHIKKGLNLVSSSRRKLQRQEREHDREEKADLKDRKDFMEMSLKKKHHEVPGGSGIMTV